MGKPIKILIVEDEMIIAADISMQLSNLGYEVSGIITRGEEVIPHIHIHRPDIVLFDIQLRGKLDGIETVSLMQREYNIPVIYLTANTDESHFNKAKATNPSAFISKPFKKLDLKHAIELTINNITQKVLLSNNYNSEPNKFVLSDRIFVRDNDKIVKIIIENILYIEADRNYCRVYTNGKTFHLVTTLKDMDRKLPKKHFIRVHRSYIVNLSQIDEITNKHLLISRKVIPISKSSKYELLRHLQTI